ncbi:type IX secretion system sortase PorU [Chryseobacterium sp. T1]
MKERLLFVIYLIISLPLFSQKVILKWEGSKSVNYGTEKLNFPYFTNEGYTSGTDGISYTTSVKNSGNTINVENMQWVKIDPKDYFDINPSSLPNRDNIAIIYNNYNSSNNAIESSVSVNTLKQENNTVYRLLSFDITNTGKPYVRKIAKKIGNTENPLKNGTFYKIKVDKSGVFKITRKFLQDNGINPSNINPKNFRIYGNGGLMLPENNLDNRYDGLQENAIQVIGEDDGVWNENDYALFYAQGPNGYNLYNGASRNTRKETRSDTPYNLINIYENFAYYYINFDVGPGKRVNDDNINAPAELITRYDDYQYINEEKFNLLKLGRVWVGDSFIGNKKVSFNTRSALKSDDEIKIRTRVISFNGKGNFITFNINNNPPDQYNPSDEYSPIVINKTIFGLTGNSIDFNYTTNMSVNPNGQFYWDYAEATYPQDLTFNNSQMNFRKYNIDEGSQDLYGFSMTSINGLEQIWDISDITNAKRKINKSGSNSVFNFGYLANSTVFNNEFVAFNQSAAFNPQFVARIDNQDLSSITNVDYLIITQPNMLGEAQRLANYHRTKNGYNVETVDVNKIYNEYSSGSKDITAIRDFVTKLKRQSNTLKYVFILGDTSYDFKNRIPNNSDIIPSYQSEYSGDLTSSYVTDDYFVMTSPQDASEIIRLIPDLPIGRLPAANISEAKLLIDKTLAYYNALPGQSTPFGEWRMKLDFVVDDDFDNNLPFHKTINNAIVANFENNTDKPEYNIRKLYLDAFPAEISAGGQRYPQINQAISNDISNSNMIFYFGHGGINGWAQERVLTSSEVNNFNNYNSVFSRFPLVSTITCEFTLWDDPNTNSVGEQVIKQKTGGAATMITSSRKIGVSYGEEFSSKFINKLFTLSPDQDFYTLGDAFLSAKKEHKAHADHLRVNFLGDPAMKMARPKKQMEITTIPDQIRALDFIKINGQVNKADGSLDSSFNGRVIINIFEQKLNKSTLNNDKLPPKGNPPVSMLMNYKEEGSPIVKASGTVVNGKYTVEFYVPKDINYEIGNGRILAYADNKSFDVFTNKVQKIGDINPNGVNDQEPPKVNLYMNNTNFANGGITDQNPTLLACLTDNLGINSTGSGIGHDITVILDGEVINTVVLNDFFSAGEGNGCINPSLADYQKGNVSFPFRNLKPGEHQLTFKVWDINNNSTTSTLNFVVKDESNQQLIINRPLNWPNPFTNKTYVQFEHNCDELLDVNVQIYTITGKLVRTLSANVTAEPFLEGFRTPRQAIEWDGKDDFGDTVAKGTYIFKIFARSQNQDKCKGSATAVEKMVLLK